MPDQKYSHVGAASPQYTHDTYTQPIPQPDAAAGREGVFQLGQGGARVVERVGPSAPVEDFDALVAGGRLDDAYGGMAVGCGSCFH